MIWLNPIAWIAATAVAVPVLVHLLAHRRAERVPFPTLRFIHATRLATIRRRTLEDLPLLAVRSAIVLFAVAAFAGPLLGTPSRRASWNTRLVRAVVGPAGAADDAREEAFRTERIEAADLGEGIHRAVAWLESAPPARREIVLAAPLTIGSLRDADLAAVPPDVGIRFVRAGTPATSRSVSGERIATSAGIIQPVVTLAGRDTAVREDDPAGPPEPWPIEVSGPPQFARAIDAAKASVLAQRVPVPPADRRARLILVDDPPSAIPDVAPIRVAWMADATARITRDASVVAESARAAKGFSGSSLSTPPWQPVARAADGRPVVSAAAAGSQLLVVLHPREDDLLLPIVLRAMAYSLAANGDLRAEEIVPIDDAQIRAWTRAPGAPPPPQPDTVERDDRRWLWIAVLALLALETWMRRARRDVDDVADRETARVA